MLKGTHFPGLSLISCCGNELQTAQPQSHRPGSRGSVRHHGPVAVSAMLGVGEAWQRSHWPWRPLRSKNVVHVTERKM